jgi:hypothetical protein
MNHHHGGNVNEEAISIMVIAHIDSDDYTDVPPPLITPEIEQSLLEYGFPVSKSDAIWVDGWRVYSPRAVRAGLYQSYIPPSNFTRVASPEVRIPSIEEIEGIEGPESLIEILIRMRGKPRGD